MKIKQKITQLMVAMGILVAIGTVMPVSVALAADCKPDASKGIQCCAGVETSLIPCTQKGGEDATARESGVWGLLLIALNILTGGVGIAAVGGVVYAAILYTTASDRADQVKKAKDVLQNVAIGIAAYAGMYLFLNFLIPGGIFS